MKENINLTFRTIPMGKILNSRYTGLGDCVELGLVLHLSFKHSTEEEK